MAFSSEQFFITNLNGNQYDSGEVYQQGLVFKPINPSLPITSWEWLYHGFWKGEEEILNPPVLNFYLPPVKGVIKPNPGVVVIPDPTVVDPVLPVPTSVPEPSYLIPLIIVTVTWFGWRRWVRG